MDVARARDAWIWRFKVENGIPLEEPRIESREDLLKFLPGGLQAKEVSHA